MRSEDQRQTTNDNSSDSRRAGTRMPFEGLVEVGGAVGPAFEAQAIDVSAEGMHLRTAYLPDIGQRLSCRFDAGPSSSVLASGEVVWRREEARGGEFGVRFEELDEESALALEHITGAAAAAAPAAPFAPSASKPSIQVPGSKVRLHIEGLGSPMRAKVKGAQEHAITVGSELGFLQVGKELDLEDAGTGEKRPARIDRVEVELDAASRMPNLVVTLKYCDQPEPEIEVTDTSKERTPGPSTLEAERPSIPVRAKSDSSAAAAADDDDDLEAIRRASGGFQGAFARGAAQVGPAISKFAKRAQMTVALLAVRAKGSVKDDMQIPIRRTTAKAPGGGLHTSGRKVVRGDSMSSESDDGYLPPKTKVDKRKLAIGGAIGAAVLLTAIAMRKPAAPPATATAPADGTATTAPLAAAGAAVPAAAGVTDPALAGTPGAAMPGMGANAMTMPPATIMPSSDPNESSFDMEPGKASKQGKRTAQVQPFGNGPVSHGNVLKLKMDGAIEKLQGASQPTGFTVVVPNRRSLEAAGPLAARDSRIASIRVTNDPNGAELSIAFKDGVPNYQVRGKGDTLEIALAPLGTLPDAKHEAKAGSGHLPGKHADAKHIGGKTHGHPKKH